MSFRDLLMPPAAAAATGRDPPPPEGRAVRDTMVAPPTRGKMSVRSFVMHGKVHYIDDTASSSSSTKSSHNHKSHESQTVIEQRVAQQRHSMFSQLSYEVQQFQALVANLETVLDSASTHPEAMWRARILMSSAQETDQDLCQKLYAYEKTLSQGNNVRAAQSACLKLHRDFKRIHRSLVMTLTLQHQRQHAEVSRLGAVGWSGKEEEDFFDEAFRKAEVEKVNASMHKVNDIYKDLSNYVEAQQFAIDQVQERVREAKETVESAAEHFQCHAEQRRIMCGAVPMEVAESGPCTVSFGKAFNCEEPVYESVAVSADDDIVEVEHLSLGDLRVTESFNYSMPFETLKQDMLSIRKDLINLGEMMMTQSQLFECGAMY